VLVYKIDHSPIKAFRVRLEHVVRSIPDIYPFNIWQKLFESVNDSLENSVTFFSRDKQRWYLDVSGSFWSEAGKTGTDLSSEGLDVFKRLPESVFRHFCKSIRSQVGSHENLQTFFIVTASKGSHRRSYSCGAKLEEAERNKRAMGQESIEQTCPREMYVWPGRGS
jgi:hypothetical protein